MNKYYGKCLSTEETAKLLKVTIYTVYNYVKVGKLHPVNLSYGTARPRYGFYEEDVRRFMEERSEGHGNDLYPNPYEVKSNVKLLELKKELKKIEDRLMNICIEY